MRRFLITAALLALAASLSAQDWVEMGPSNDGSVWYLNPRTIEDHGSYVTGWVMVEFSDAAKSRPTMQLMQSLLNREISYRMSLCGAKKNSRQIRLIQDTSYDKNGYVVFSPSPQEMQQSGRGDWEHCAPGTVAEAVWEALMEAARRR